ncbi:MAG: hypothetical protein AB7I98_19525 [Verrucomicrobiales bacterium]|nr:hypothetical protein [Akkermansiaceae bacterium]
MSPKISPPVGSELQPVGPGIGALAFHRVAADPPGAAAAHEDKGTDLRVLF